jgi:chemotaxis protein MotB
VSGHRKKGGHAEEHENHERWLVSYADFMTLLFALFVVMYAVSRVDTKKAKQVEESVKWALHMGGEGGVTKMAIFEGPPSEGGGIAKMAGTNSLSVEQRQVIEAFRRKVENRVRPFVMEKAGATAVSVEIEDRLVKVRLSAGEFFEPGEAALRPQALPVLDAIAEEIVPMHQPIQVEGHTDDQPVSGGRFRDNWELSAARAATVVSFLEKAHHAAPRLLTASGFADTRPVSRDATPEARELNRRVEMVVELDLPDAPPQRPQATQPKIVPRMR